MGVLDVPRPKGRKAEGKTAGEAESETESLPQTVPPVISYEEFREYVPRDQLVTAAFKKRILQKATYGAIPFAMAVEIAETVGAKGQKEGSLERTVRQLLRSVPDLVELFDPKDSDTKNPTSCFGLSRFLGDKGKPVRAALYDWLVETIQAKHTELTLGYARAGAGATINVLQQAGILTIGDLESAIEAGTLANTSGLGSINASATDRLSYVLEAYDKFRSGSQPPKTHEPYTRVKESEARGLVDYTTFRGFVPRKDYVQAVFVNKVLQTAVQLCRPISEHEVAMLAEEVGIKARGGKPVIGKARQLLIEEGKFDKLALPDPDYPDPQSAPSYFGLKK
ncbi:MAG: hypothetical protein AABX69_02580, partial [Nanoarchaeota archaeon]